MAQSRINKAASIFTRMNGLIKSNIIKQNEIPLWFDIYKRFPPKRDPAYRSVLGNDIVPKLPRNLFYEQDELRVYYFSNITPIETIVLNSDKRKPSWEIFISTYNKLKSDGVTKNDLVDATIDNLQEQGFYFKKKKMAKKFDQMVKDMEREELVEQEIPLSEQNLFTSDTVQMIKEAKEKNQSAFQSYWEYDENDIDQWSDKEIEAHDDKKFITLAENGRLSEIKMLVQNQKNYENVASLLKFKDSDGYTALHRAAYSNSLEVVKYLLNLEEKLSVRVNQLDAVTDMGWTPLHSACYWNSFKVVEYLIKYCNADCNFKSNSGQTCLHLIAQQSSPKESLLLLLTNPFTRFGSKNSQGETAYDIAIRSSKFNYLFEITQDHLNIL